MNNLTKYGLPLIIPTALLAQDFSKDAINKAIENFGEKEVKAALWAYQLNNGNEEVKDSIANYLNQNLYDGSGAVFTSPKTGTQLNKWSDGTNVADIAMVGSGLGRFKDEYLRDNSTTLPSTFNELGWNDKEISEFMFNNFGAHQGIDYKIHRNDEGQILYLESQNESNNKTRNRETIDGKLLENHRNWVPERVQNNPEENYLSFPVKDGLKLAGAAVTNIIGFINKYDSLNIENQNLDNINKNLEVKLENTTDRNKELEGQNSDLSGANYRLNQDNQDLKSELKQWGLGVGMGLNSDGKAIYLIDGKGPLLGGLGIVGAYQNTAGSGESQKSKKQTPMGFYSVSELEQSKEGNAASLDLYKIMPVSEKIALTPSLGIGSSTETITNNNKTYFENQTGERWDENAPITSKTERNKLGVRVGGGILVEPAHLRYTYDSSTDKHEIQMSIDLYNLLK